MFNFEKYTEILSFIKKDQENCQIVAISKNHPKESVLEAINKGVLVFGENRVMEAKEKFENLKEIHPKLELHLTGPLQSNKVKIAAKLFDVFHTLDREKIAREFSKYKDIISNKKIFIQVNTGEETNKSGVYPSELKKFSQYCIKDLELNICGLMCIPPVDENPEKHFELLKNLSKENNLNELSIGMSSDYKEALNFNPRYIRIGTVLFGSRQ